MKLVRKFNLKKLFILLPSFLLTLLTLLTFLNHSWQTVFAQLPTSQTASKVCKKKDSSHFGISIGIIDKKENISSLLETSHPVLSELPLWTYEDYLKEKTFFSKNFAKKFSKIKQLYFLHQLKSFKNKMEKKYQKSFSSSHKSISAEEKAHIRHKILKLILKQFNNRTSDHLLQIHQQIDETLKEFVQVVKETDPNMSEKDIARARQNAWVLHSLQAMMEKEIKVTPTILGFSMLYPYTDDIMDDPQMDKKQKRDFIIRFGQLISQGLEKIPTAKPTNEKEEKIWQMFHLIESEIPRSKYPGPYQAMSDLHQAQIESTKQQPSNKEDIPEEKLIFDITVKKGAASIFADAFLIDPRLNHQLSYFAAIFGSITQFLNDLKTFEEDLAEGQYTVFNLTYKKGERLDIVTTKVLNYIHHTFAHFDQQTFPNKNISKELAQQIGFYLKLKVYEEVARHQHLYSPQYVKKIEQFLPLPLDAFKALLDKQNMTEEEALKTFKH